MTKHRFLAKLLCHRLHRFTIHKFTSLQDVTELNLRLLENVNYIFKRLTSDDSKLLGARHRRTQDSALGNHSQRAFSANEQMLQVITCVILAQGRDVVENLSAR